MDNIVAGYLLASLAQRINSNQLGVVSDQEKEALAVAIGVLGGGLISTGISAIPLDSAAPCHHEQSWPGVPKDPSGSAQPKIAPEAPLPEVRLVLTALERTQPSDEGVLLCLDFGTAMSKAFASTTQGEHLELELGTEAGKQGYLLPSSVFIGNDEKVYFGFDAIEKSSNLEEIGRERLDSLKSWLSLREEGSLDEEILSHSFNPTPYTLTQADLIRMYLAYLTDMSVTSLAEWERGSAPIGRYVLRRFARPCGKDVRQAAWVDDHLKQLLAEAQLIADTLHGEWGGGIAVPRVKAVLKKIKSLGQSPDYLIDVGVPEPVAVAASSVANSENRIDAYMVVDAGAGTTDFGLFFVIRNQALADAKVFQVTASIRGLNQAGDKVDLLLQAFIRSKESIEAGSTLGKMVEAALRRDIRIMKELLFTNGKLEYVLADSTVGTVELADFLGSPHMQQFARRVEDGFREALENVDVSYLDYLAMDPVRLNVILTGGSSKLPMMSSLATGYIEVNGRKIRRISESAAPEWLDDEPEEMRSVYPQLAVAIGGATEDLPSTDFGPEKFIRISRPTYVAERVPISGL